MTDITCPHADPMCPCNDGDGAACHYEDVVVAGTVSKAARCTNPWCPICDNGPKAA